MLIARAYFDRKLDGIATISFLIRSPLPSAHPSSIS
jgi:hypothetical protein